MDKPPANIYPVFAIEHIQTPNRLWAIPILGGLIKILILIPVFLELFFVFFYLFFVSVINSFIILFSGKYWHHCFEISQGTIKLITKTQLFFLGLTDKYPGFNLNVTNFKMDFTYPKNPSRVFAIPVLGFIFRIVLLIPYFIFLGAVANGGFIGTVIGSFVVLFKGRYPETSYELARDSSRLAASQLAYIYGISDEYPSFWISMNHQTLKILLIIMGASNMINGNAPETWQNKEDCNYYNYTFKYDQYKNKCFEQFMQFKLQEFEKGNTV